MTARKFQCLPVQDAAFAAFRAVLLTPIPGLTLDTDEGQTVAIWINANTHADYLARGVFHELTALPLVGSGLARGLSQDVSASYARAMLADANEQREAERAQGYKHASKWSFLRNRLGYALERMEWQLVGGQS